MIDFIFSFEEKICEIPMLYVIFAYFFENL